MEDAGCVYVWDILRKRISRRQWEKRSFESRIAWQNQVSFHIAVNQTGWRWLVKPCQGKREFNGFSLIWKSDSPKKGPGLGWSGDSYIKTRIRTSLHWVFSGMWEPGWERGWSMSHTVQDSLPLSCCTCSPSSLEQGCPTHMQHESQITFTTKSIERWN